jgi:cold shock CspA family protein
MKGVIKAVIKKDAERGRNGGYFFIIGEDTVERFAHASNLQAPATFPGTSTSRPSDIHEGQAVEFEPIEIPGKGLRADRVQVL